MSQPQPFSVHVSDEQLARIYRRVKDFHWHEMPVDGGWESGTNLKYLQQLCEYWVSDFDWRKHEQQLNRLTQFTTVVDELPIHYIIEKGSGEHPLPLIISHGWPGSVLEFMKVIQPLAHPQHYGGDANDGFDVIVPSLPGFGFSGKPPRPFGPRKMARLFNTLMAENLGYERYIAQGGDWGGAISSWLGFEGSHCCGIHINILTMRHPQGPQTPEEREWAEQFERDQIMQNGYRTQQATKPQTLSYAMMDSPVGVAAWILEKFHGWSDLEDNKLESVYSKDELLANIMIYIITRTFNTASWIYYGRREEGGRILSPEGARVEVPTAAAVFPREMLAWPPRSYVERIYNLSHWTEFPRGGHFAAMEQPQLLVEDIRHFAKQFR